MSIRCSVSLVILSAVMAVAPAVEAQICPGPGGTPYSGTGEQWNEGVFVDGSGAPLVFSAGDVIRLSHEPIRDQIMACVTRGGVDIRFFGVVSLATMAPWRELTGDTYLRFANADWVDVINAGQTITCDGESWIGFPYNGFRLGLFGEQGHDSIRGGSGDDDICGGPGNDAFLFGDSGDDLIEGDTGNDRIFGGAGCDETHGNEGSDLLDDASVECGVTELYGGSGPDCLEVSTGIATLLDCGSESDVASFFGAPTVVSCETITSPVLGAHCTTAWTADPTFADP